MALNYISIYSILLYTIKWCLLWESNPGPSLYKRDALPTVPKRRNAVIRFTNWAVMPYRLK